jgi:hypothetical protein
MHPAAQLAVVSALAAGLALATALPAAAKCTRLGFSVNDYGKEGPTKDAQELLDKHIAAWTAEQGIKTYKVGTKSIDCELFLNLIVFDEHTCKAEADVCWDEKPAAPAKPVQAKSKSTAKQQAKAAPAARTMETGTLPGKVLIPPGPAAAPGEKE